MTEEQTYVHEPVAAEATLGRRLLAEFVGTLLFVAAGVGAAVVVKLIPAQALGRLDELFGGQPGQTDVFKELLGGSFSDVMAVALTFAFALSLLVYAFGGVSGAHFNPAVTFGLAVSRRFNWGEVGPYWIAQCIGAFAGVLVIAGIYGQGDIKAADFMFGATTIADGVNQAQALLAEAFITFLLMTAVMAVAVDPRAPKGFSGIGIGLSLAAGIMVTAAATGGSANFARSLGPFVVSLFYDLPEGMKVPWGDLMIYAGGPLIGAAAAALVYESVTGLETVSPAPTPGAATGSSADHHHAPGESHVHSHNGDLHSHPHDHEAGPDHNHDH